MGQDLAKHSKVSGSNDSLHLSKLRSLQCNRATSKCKFASLMSPTVPSHGKLKYLAVTITYKTRGNNLSLLDL